ncbi:MAG: Do family serine endopeptidase [Spirochaetaceae bacterium]|nr:MAG: Do family serine endopeptidase [Spirochaetaceae bacterium]
MSQSVFYSRRFFLFNLVLSGLILGFVLSVVMFSCSTQIRPGSRVEAQETQPAPTVQSLEDLQSSFRYVADTVLPSVVQVTVRELRTSADSSDETRPWYDFFFRDQDRFDAPSPRSQGLGSGVIVRANGDTFFVLTNNHVIGNANDIRVVLDDDREFPARMIGGDTRMDLALLSFESQDRDIRLARLGDSDTMHVGDWVMAIGSPFGFQSTVTAGIVSALGRRGGPAQNISDFIQTDAAINQGNSGGALVNLAGEVVGINTWISSQTGYNAGLGFSIPINNARRAIDDFITRGAIQYGWLGVSIRTVSGSFAEELGVARERGALVMNVFLDGPAFRDGLLPGDFITSINGRAVRDSDELVLIVGSLPAGETAEFTVIRQTERTTVPVTIALRDESSVGRAANSWPGMTPFPITPELRREMDIGRTEGIVVDDVDPRAPAGVAGLRVGDLVTAINGRRITSVLGFYQYMNEPTVDELAFTVVRNGDRLEIKITR